MMLNIGLMKNFKKYNLRTPQAVVSHQSTQSTRRSAKTLGTRPAAGYGPPKKL